jgi:RimJ/RimL family protein N-acetyltransferase
MLKGKLICLTEVRRDDTETLYRWINDAETVRFNAPWRPVPWANHSGWFDGIGRDQSKVVLVIRKEPTGAAIGVIQLLDIHPVHRSAELTTRIGSESDRGEGYGTEALKLALDFARRDLNLGRVWLRVFATNERAIRAYTKAGFEIEGTMRRAAWINGAWVDEIIMASLMTP